MITPEDLAGFSIFDGFDERALAGICGVLRPRELLEGEVVVRQGNHDGGCFLVLGGELRVSRETPDGGSVDLMTLQRGAVFGLVGAIDRNPRAATVVAKGGSRVAELDRDSFAELLDGRSRLAFRFQLGICRELIRDIRAANQRLAQLATLPAQEISLVSLSEALPKPIY